MQRGPLNYLVQFEAESALAQSQRAGELRLPKAAGRGTMMGFEFARGRARNFKRAMP